MHRFLGRCPRLSSGRTVGAALALYLFFLPLGGAGAFGLKHGGWKFTLYLLLINLPYGIFTALVARATIEELP